MGGNLDYATFEDASEAELRKQFDEAIKQAGYESGYSYSGAISMMSGIASFHDLGLENESAAASYLAENHEKWDDAMAVSFWHQPAAPAPQRAEHREKLHDEWMMARKRFMDAKAEAVRSFVEGGDGFITCPRCGSTFNRAYMKHTDCPMCNTSVFYASTDGRLQQLKEESDAKYVEYQEYSIYAPTGERVKMWAIGGNCAS